MVSCIIAALGGAAVVHRYRKSAPQLRTFVLPEEIRPGSPDEVGTIAWIEKQRRVIGKYTGGSEAIQHAWDVTLVDRTTKATLCRRTFEGTMPPKVKGSASSGEGTSPEDQV